MLKNSTREKMFNHIPTKLPVLETAHEDNRHYYISPEGEKYPSITSILHSFPNPGIEIWKSKTPNWQEIQNESFEVGTELHKMIECYLKNEYVPLESKRSIDLFNNLFPELNKINNIRCQEAYLYEPNLRISGATDCIAEYDGILSVIDFKQARKVKIEKYVKTSGYYLQITGYAKMFEYCTGIKIDDGVIMIADWNGGINIHKIKIKDYEDDLEALIESYYNSENNR
jgi:hypothetical protein